MTRYKVFAAAAAVFFISVFSLSVSARERICKGRDPYPFDFEVRVGWGGVPLFYDSFFSYDYDVSPDFNTSLGSIYGPYRGPQYVTGVFSAEFDMNFRKWFTVTVGVGFSGRYRNYYDSLTEEKAGRENEISVTFLPELRFNWLNREYFRMYSAVGLGFGLHHSNDCGYVNREMFPLLQLTYFGISVGKKVYGFAECGVGMQYTGIMAGLGYRF